MTVRWERAGDVGLVTLDAPPVNAIGLAVRQGLADALDWAAVRDLRHVVLTGAGRAFAAGADAREFDADPVPPHLPDLCDAIEDAPVPWVAAINGVALGGGCELALACRHRIAAPGARIGLPEVTLGVVPGAGGTQRLPRLVGMAAALDMIASGKPVTAETARAMGLIDAIADDPAAAAAALTAVPGDAVGRRPRPAPDAEAVAVAEATAARRMRGQVAPSRAIGLVAASSERDLADGMAGERAAFLELRQDAQAKALRHLFFAERTAAKPPVDAGPATLDHVAVVGGGTMGAGIAYACLNAGLRVTVTERPDGIDRGRANVERVVASSLKAGRIDAAGADDRRARLTVTAEPPPDATLAIEAAFESMEVKRAVFARLADALPSDAVLATNTSYLDVDAIARTVADPSRVVGLHFFAPAHVMKLLEIVRGAATSDRALATGHALAKRLGKVPVTVGVCDGFVGNRILARHREAADALLMDGALPHEVDAAMEAFGYPMGPYAAQDLSGLDIAHANRRREDATRDPARRYVPIADRVVEAGRLGRKAGAGWYAYDGERAVDPAVQSIVLEESRKAGIERRSFAPDDIAERLVAAMANEAALILEEGIAASPADIDLVTVLGYGFPRWRGGLTWHADAVGLDRIAATLEVMQAEDPVAWRMAPLLADRAACGAGFHDR